MNPFALVAVGTFCSTLLLGQAAGDGAMPAWLSGLLGQVPIVGALVWYLYYNTTTYLPNKDAAHAAAITAVVDKCDGWIEKLSRDRETDRAALKDFCRGCQHDK